MECCPGDKVADDVPRETPKFGGSTRSCQGEIRTYRLFYCVHEHASKLIDWLCLAQMHLVRYRTRHEAAHIRVGGAGWGPREATEHDNILQLVQYALCKQLGRHNTYANHATSAVLTESKSQS